VVAFVNGPRPAIGSGILFVTLAARTLPIEQLFLDEANPRHGPTGSQREAMAAMIRDQGDKLVKLATDIAKHGVSPVDTLIVVRRGSNYTVLEGNRRALVVKLLNNPELAQDTDLEKEFLRLSKNAKIPKSLEAVVFPNAKAARHWIQLRHDGEAGGAGVVRWGAAQRSRFQHRPGSQSARALAFISSARAAYRDDDGLAASLEKIETDRLTTLGRLVADSDFRSLYGIQEEKDGRLLWLYPAETMRPFVTKLASDLAGKVSVTTIKTKKHRAEYYKIVGTPDPAAQRKKALPLESKSAAAGPAGKAAHAKLPKPGPVFGGFAPKNMGQKLVALLKEIRKLDENKTPNVCAVLTRVVIEIAVDQAYANMKWPLNWNDKLRDKVARCLKQIDPSGKDKQYQGVRVGIADANSLTSVTTLHAFVHGAAYRALPDEVRTIADNYEPFLNALDKLGNP
jgi:hypothetical protein